MKRYLRLLFTFFKYRLQLMTIYRVNFIAWSLVAVGWFVFNIAFFQLLFSHVDSIGGWNKGQVFVLQGFYFLIDFVIWGILHANFEDFPRRVNRGQIDAELTKPINARFLFSFKNFNLDNLINLILGIVTIGYGLSLNQTVPSVTEIIAGLMLFAISCIYIYAGYFAFVCLCFWFERLDNIVFIFPQIRTFAKIPLSGYHGLPRIFLSYVVPAALIATIPAEALFGVFQFKYILLLLFFALVTLLLSSLIFQTGLKRYSSASS